MLWTRAAGVAETTRDGKTEIVSGAGELEEELRVFGASLRFRVSPEAFFQVHTEQAERLYAIAAELAGLRDSERVFDLYSGIGTIALCLALRAREVLGIESIEPAVADAIETRADNSFGMRRTEVVCKRCGGHLGHLFDDGPRDRGGMRFCINSCALELTPKP